MLANVEHGNSRFRRRCSYIKFEAYTCNIGLKGNVQMGVYYIFYRFRKLVIWPTSNTVRDVTTLCFYYSLVVFMLLFVCVRTLIACPMFSF